MSETRLTCKDGGTREQSTIGRRKSDRGTEGAPTDGPQHDHSCTSGDAGVVTGYGDGTAEGAGEDTLPTHEPRRDLGARDRGRADPRPVLPL